MWYKMTNLKEMLEKKSIGDLKILREALGPTPYRVGSDIYKEAGRVMNAKIEAEKKPKGIDIKMTCGEEHHIDTDQPTIETVKVNGEQIYPLETGSETQTIKDAQDFALMFSKLTGKKWVFEGHDYLTNYERMSKKYVHGRPLSECFSIPWNSFRGYEKGYMRFGLKKP